MVDTSTPPPATDEELALFALKVWQFKQGQMVSFMLHLGDICLTDGRRPRDWEVYLRENREQDPLLDRLAVVPVLGTAHLRNAWLPIDFL